jgi:Tfp pilus assembly protein PilO
MTHLFKWTIILIIIFILAIAYYIYIWISFESLDLLRGDSKELVFINKTIY